MKFSLQVNDGTCKYKGPTCKIDESLASENLKSKKCYVEIMSGCWLWSSAPCQCLIVLVKPIVVYQHSAMPVFKS